MNKFFIFALVLTLLSAKASNVNSFQAQADFICSQINDSPKFDYNKSFAASFQQKISYENLVSIFQNIAKEDGACSQAVIVNITAAKAKVKLITNTNVQKVEFSLDKDNLINSLFFSGLLNPKGIIKNEADLKSKLLNYGVLTGLSLNNFSTKKSVISINNKQRIGLGSEFKLYVLNKLAATISENIHSWNEQLTLKEELKSFPSGTLQNEPAGTPLSLQQYAGLMISISDNTATDHLIDLLGKPSIESSLHGINSYLSENSPFMMTMDLFRTKTLSTDEARNYLLSSSEQKITILNNLKQKYTDPKKLAEDLSSWDAPKHITSLEWFANTDDICSVMEELQRKSEKDPMILQVLSINTPFYWSDSNDPYFDYVGYKGGSEPGVLTMTFLVKTKKQEWACLSMAINDQVKNLNEDEVMDFYHSALVYAGKVLNN